MAPELVEEFVTAAGKRFNEDRAQAEGQRRRQQHELEQVERKLDALIATIAEGYRSPRLQTELDALESRRSAIEAELTTPAPPPLRLHPNLAQVYRDKVAQLAAAFTRADIAVDSRDLLRGLIDRIVVVFGEERGVFEVQIEGRLAAILGLAHGETKDAACVGIGGCGGRI